MSMTSENRGYSALIVTRNEADKIASVLKALKDQTIPPREIILVDASTDGTAEIARSYGAKVYSLPAGRSLLGTPALAETINVGLQSMEHAIGQVLNLDADTILPPDYAEKIISRMEKDGSLGICSGRKEGERADPDIPRHSMMIVSARIWELVDWRYPVVWGYEFWLQEKAKALGYKLRCFTDIEVPQLRKTNLGKGTNDGKAMYALGYPALYALGRSAFLCVHSPSGGLKMAWGFMTHRGVDESNTPSDVRPLVRHEMTERMRPYLRWLGLGILLTTIVAGIGFLVLR
jgi:glycosyltransferase involved in cell wall biosynthesis